MSLSSLDMTQNDSVKSGDFDNEFDFSKLPDKPRHLNMERQRSFDERSPVDASPHYTWADNGQRPFDFQSIFSPSRRSSFNTLGSQYGLEPHPMFVEAWESLRKTMVHFHGQPVGTIAALDNSYEKLNYDQKMTKKRMLMKKPSKKMTVTTDNERMRFGDDDEDGDEDDIKNVQLTLKPACLSTSLARRPL